MAHPLASLWEDKISSFLAESNDSATIYYKPERTGGDASFDSFFQESTNPADPTGSHIGAANEIILNSDNNDYYTMASISVPDIWTISFDLYIQSNPANTVIRMSENIDGSGDNVQIYVNQRIGYSSFYPTLVVDNTAFPSQTFATLSNGDYFSYNTWHTFTVSKVGTLYTLSYASGSGSITDTKNISMSSLGYLGFLASPDGSSILSGSPRIKGLVGDIFRFGLAYTDTAETTLAVVGQDVASIKNVGSMGGSFIQSLADNQSDLYTGSNNTEVLSETTPDSVTVSNGKSHLDLQGTTMGSTESDQKIDIGKFSDADALFTCLLSDIQISTNPDPVVTLFDDDVDSVKYVVLAKDGKRYDIQGVRPRGMGSAPFVVDVFLKLTNKEI